jgi:GT2 family glycosyltransferase
VSRSERVSVIICAYTERRWNDILAAYGSLVAQTRPADEIVLVVDHNERLLAKARAALAEIMVTANVAAAGLSGARNTGLDVATGEIILFLDDDAVADRSWIQRMLEPFTDPEVMGVGGWADPRWEPLGRPSWFPEPFLWVVGCSYEGQPTSTADVRNPLGCAMGFRRSAFDLVGGFSALVGRVESRPVGCEETEFAIRLLQAKPGARIIHKPDARVTHHVTPDRTQVSYFLRRCYHEGRSKAVLSASLGPQDSLASEREYVRRTLPRATVRGLRTSLRTRRPAEAASAVAIVAGLTATAWGYGLARIQAGQAVTSSAGEDAAATDAPAAHLPVWCTELDLGGPLPVALTAPAGACYATARVLVRLHGFPLGFVAATLDGGAVEVPRLLEIIDRQLLDEVNAHLAADGVDTVRAVPSAGLGEASKRRARA